MAQTDRQTDNLAKIRNTRSTWWIVTAYEGNIEKLENPSSFPPSIKAVMGGLERCPTTGRLHGQQAIQCNGQQRGSSILDWIPGSHIEPAKSAEAIRKYCMKSDTAVGEKTVKVNTIKYYTADEICLLIGSKVSEEIMLRSADHKEWFKSSINILLRENTRLASQLMNPSLRNFWCDTALVWIDKSRENEFVEDDE